MDTVLPFLLALSIGFLHAFEADHLVAVSSIVTRRSSPLLAIKDGIFWGLGHTSTVLLMGSVLLLGRVAFQESDFRYLEAGVGLMLLGLGAYRLFRLAYGVGLVHGVAGSGAVILSVLATLRSAPAGLLYLLLFGVGSVGGMMVAAGVFSMPFSKRVLRSRPLRVALTVLSSLLCLGLGGRILYENLLG